MNISDNLKNIYNNAISNDGKIDQKEFESLKTEILNDNKVDPDERAFLNDTLSEGKFEKGSVLSVIALFSDENKEPSSDARTFFEIAMSNDKKIDSKEFPFLKKELLSDSKIDTSEKEFLVEKLADGAFDKTVVPFVAELISDTDNKGNNQLQKGEENKLSTEPIKIAEKKTETKEEPSHWEHKFSVSGGFNNTVVSKGWSQYGKETSATKIEGSFGAEVNYHKDKHKLNNKFLIEYGQVALKGGDTSVTKDNQEFTSEYTYQILKKGALSVEIPYAKLYTKGPFTELGNRSIRESSGIKVVFDNDKTQSKYSLNLGGGLQQTHDKEKKKWENNPGAEVIFDAKQRLGFLTESYVKASKTNEDNVDFLNRIEINGGVNAFMPLQEGFKASTMDITLNAGAKLFLNKSESIWLGASEQWRYGGKPDSSWEKRFVTDIGFKF